jgi:hypothetical protein
MDTFYGYNGGETLEELAEFISKALAADEGNAVDKIKTLYFPIGHVMEIARRKKEVQEMGIQVWCSTVKNPRTGKSFSYPMINNCYRAWRLRDKFDAALAWYQNPGRNSHWTPPKPNGPLFVIDLVAAYEGKDKPAKAKSPTKTPAKVLLRRYQILREQFGKVAAEHRKFAAELDREPVALQAAEHALAQEFGEDGKAEVKPGFHSDTGTDATASGEEMKTDAPDQASEGVEENPEPPPNTSKVSKSKRQKREAALAQTAVAGAEAAEAETVTKDHAQPAEPAGEAPKGDDTATAAEPAGDDSEQAADDDDQFDIFQKGLAELMAEYRANQGSKSNKKFNDWVARVQAFQKKWAIYYPVRPPTQHLATLGLKRKPATLSELTKAYHAKAKDYLARSVRTRIPVTSLRSLS